jgi:hypothetical protein
MSEHCEERCGLPPSLTYELYGTARTERSNMVLPKTCRLVIKDENDRIVKTYYFVVECTAEITDAEKNLYIPKQMILNLFDDLDVPTEKAEVNQIQVVQPEKK